MACTKKVHKKNQVNEVCTRTVDKRSVVKAMAKSDRSWMRGVPGLADHGVEPIMVVGGVVHGPHATIGLHQRVGTLDDVAVAHLVLGLVVAGVAVLDAVVELVLGISLEGSNY